MVLGPVRQIAVPATHETGATPAVVDPCPADAAAPAIAALCTPSQTGARGPSAQLPATLRGLAPAGAHGVATRGAPSREPVEVVYIQSGGGFTMRLARVGNRGYVGGAESVRGMVDAILAKAAGRPIERLVLVGHGAPGSQTLADGVDLDVDTLAAVSNELRRLAPHFAKGAYVQLDGCKTGAGARGERLLVGLAQLLGIEVRAGVVRQCSNLEGIEGTMVLATPRPDGSVMVHSRGGTMDGLYRLPDSLDLRSDDDALAEVEASNEQALRDLGDDRRAFLVRSLLDGFCRSREQDAVMRIFRALPPAERRALYRHVEKHAWSGDFIEGLWVADDRLWNKLSHPRLRQLRQLLNG